MASRGFYISAICFWTAITGYEGLRAFSAHIPFLAYGTVAAEQKSAAGRALETYVIVGVAVLAVSVLLRVARMKVLSSTLAVLAVALPASGHLVLRDRFPVYRSELSAMDSLHLPSTYTVRSRRVSAEDYYVVQRSWNAPTGGHVCEVLTSTISAWGPSTPIKTRLGGCAFVARRGRFTLLAFGETSSLAGVFAAVSESSVSACRATGLPDQCF